MGKRVFVLLVGFILTCLMMLLFAHWMFLDGSWVNCRCFQFCKSHLPHEITLQKDSSTFQADGSEGELRGLGLPVLLCRQHLIWNPTTEILPALG